MMLIVEESVGRWLKYAHLMAERRDVSNEIPPFVFESRDTEALSENMLLIITVFFFPDIFGN